MAERKPLFMDATEGFSEEMSPTADTMTLLGLKAGASGVDLQNVGKVVNLVAASADGDALAYGQSSANLAGLSIDTNPLTMGSQKITSLAAGTDPGDAINKGQLDAAVQGFTWKDPVSVFKMVNDTTQAGSPPTAGQTGEAWVVDTWGVGYNDGDIVEWDGAAWQVIVANSGGAVPDGTQVLVDGSPAGSFTGYTNQIALYTTGTGWSFYDPADGDAVLVAGDGSVYENNGYIWDDNTTTWIQFTGAGQIIAGDGLSKDGNTIDVNAGDGITIATDRVAIELSASNPGLELTGTTPDKTLQVLVDGAHGIIRGASGLEIEIDDTPDTLDVDADGLKVVGVPSLFKINGTAVGVNVTAANLDELTGGGSTTLHSHAGADEAERVEKSHNVDEAIAIADPVYISSANRVGKALANNNAKSRVVGLAKTAQGTVGQPSDIVHHGLAAGVLSGATAGTPYYLQAAGGIGTSLPAGGSRVIQMGIAYNATDLWVHIHDYGKKAA
jgi:hypothetical protein